MTDSFLLSIADKDFFFFLRLEVYILYETKKKKGNVKKMSFSLCMDKEDLWIKKKRMMWKTRQAFCTMGLYNNGKKGCSAAW
jgi:hypothetical protein